MIDAAELVAVARRLNAGHPPSGESVRRAVSTAYYALFHALVGDAAERFVGAAPTSVAFEVIYRGFNHADINRVFVAVDKPTLSDAYKRRLRRQAASRPIRDFAETFIATQELRHLADYNPLIDIAQSEAADLIDGVGAALPNLANADPQEKADLFAIMLAGMRAT